MPKCENSFCKKDVTELFFYSYDTTENSYQDVLICKECISKRVPSIKSKIHGRVLVNKNNSRYGGAINSAFNKV